MTWQLDINGGETPHEQVVDDTYAVGGHERFETPVVTIRDSVHPGDTCPVCTRRVPFPKKADSPQSKVFAYRVPIDDAETHGEILDAAATELGIFSEPHHRFRLALYGATLILQGARLEETGG